MVLYKSWLLIAFTLALHLSSAWILPDRIISKSNQPRGRSTLNLDSPTHFLNSTTFAPDIASPNAQEAPLDRTNVSSLGSGSDSPRTHIAWPTTWPYVVEVPVTPGLRLPNISHVEATFKSGGKECVYRGQRYVFDHRYHLFTQNWPRAPIPLWRSYENHDAYLDHILRISYWARSGIQGHAEESRLWDLTRQTIGWLKRIFDQRGCKAITVTMSAKWGDGRSATNLGFVLIQVDEPPQYAHRSTWPLFLESASIHLPISGEEQGKDTYLKLVDPGKDFWWDADPVSREFAGRMFDHASYLVRKQLGVDGRVYMPTFKDEALFVRYTMKVTTPPSGSGRWPLGLTIHVLHSLKELILRHGLIAAGFQVFYEGTLLGQVELGPVDQVARVDSAKH